MNLGKVMYGDMQRWSNANILVSGLMQLYLNNTEIQANSTFISSYIDEVKKYQLN